MITNIEDYSKAYFNTVKNRIIEEVGSIAIEQPDYDGIDIKDIRYIEMIIDEKITEIISEALYKYKDFGWMGWAAK